MTAKAGSTAAKKTPVRKKWVKNVITDSTHPPHDLFTESAAAITRSLASREVLQEGVASGLHRVTYDINRAGRI
jgi:hypothetical protein